MNLTGIAPAIDRMITVGGVTGVQAVVFDFNGTITDDDEFQFIVYAETVAAKMGAELDRAFFFGLRGLNDPDMFRAMYAHHVGGTPSPEFVETLCRDRLDRYVARVRAVSPVRPDAAAFIRALAARAPHVPLAVVTGAPRAEAAPVLAAEGLLGLFVTVVTAEDVTHGKPDPEGFLSALATLRADRPGLRADEVLVFEDATVGITAARRAGMRCIGVHLQGPEAGVDADEVHDVMGPHLLRTAD